jgi:nicotinamide-nucleotide amidase
MEDLFKIAEKIVNEARDKSIIIALAESCTGGMAATALTSVNGSSDVFDRSFVTYSYESKSELLGVSTNTLANYGAVSEQCVEEMALGAAKNSRGDITVSISGIAGPSGGMPEKPVGLVYFGYFDKKKNKLRTDKKQFSGDRHSVRVQSTRYALDLLAKMLGEH